MDADEKKRLKKLSKQVVEQRSRELWLPKHHQTARRAEQGTGGKSGPPSRVNLSPRMYAAVQHGASLPVFENLEQARSALLDQRDAALEQLASAAKNTLGLNLDFTVDSLLALEHWYFSMPRDKRADFVRSCAFYFGAVVAKNRQAAKWVIEVLPFLRGRYEIGVSEGLLTMMLSSFESKLEHQLNTTHDSMWRTYQKYFLRNPKVKIAV